MFEKEILLEDASDWCLGWFLISLSELYRCWYGYVPAPGGTVTVVEPWVVVAVVPVLAVLCMVVTTGVCRVVVGETMVVDATVVVVASVGGAWVAAVAKVKENGKNSF